MGASDVFLVLSLLGGLGYVGAVFGRAGNERRGRLLLGKGQSQEEKEGRGQSKLLSISNVFSLMP